MTRKLRIRGKPVQPVKSPDYLEGYAQGYAAGLVARENELAKLVRGILVTGFTGVDPAGNEFTVAHPAVLIKDGLNLHVEPFSALSDET